MEFGVKKFRLESSVCGLLYCVVWNRIYLQCPVMEADVLHGVSPKRLWDVVWKSEVARDQHKYSLSRKIVEKISS